MSRGIPVVVTDIEIFHEIAGDVGEYFPGESPKAFAEAVTRLENPSIWKAKSEAGIKQSQKFSWEASAAELLKLLKSL